MNSFAETAAFTRWMTGLKDLTRRAAILRRLDQARQGNFGDCESVGDGVSELRVHVGPGYRVYFCRIGSTAYLLLAGGTKTTQKRDIKQAKALAGTLQERT